MTADEDRVRTVRDGGRRTLKTADSDIPLAAGDVIGPYLPALVPLQLSMRFLRIDSSQGSGVLIIPAWCRGIFTRLTGIAPSAALDS